MFPIIISVAYRKDPTLRKAQLYQHMKAVYKLSFRENHSAFVAPMNIASKVQCHYKSQSHDIEKGF